jgi:hypothetical protein
MWSFDGHFQGVTQACIIFLGVATCTVVTANAKPTKVRTACAWDPSTHTKITVRIIHSSKGGLGSCLTVSGTRTPADTVGLKTVPRPWRDPGTGSLASDFEGFPAKHPPKVWALPSLPYHTACSSLPRFACFHHDRACLQLGGFLGR